MNTRINGRLVILIVSYILGTACAPACNSWRAAAAVLAAAASIFVINRAVLRPEKRVDEKLLLLLLLVFLCALTRGRAIIASKAAGVNSRLAENAFVKLIARAESVKYHAVKGQKTFVTATLCAEKYYNAKEGAYKQTSGKLVLKFTPGEYEPTVENKIGDGDLLEASGRIKRLHIFKNPYIGGAGNPFSDEALYSLESGSISVKLLARRPRGPIASLRSAMKELFVKYYPSEISGFLMAFVLGDPSGLSGSVYFTNGPAFDFTESGMLHVLVVSGGHITMMIAFTAAALDAFGISAGTRAAVLFLVISVYFLIIGFQAAATRAYLSFALFLLCRVLNREVSAINIFIAAFFFHSVFFPELIFSPGFWLSYISTAALIMTNGNHFDARHKADNWLAALAGYCKATGAALLSTYPAVSYSCGYFPVNSIVSNLLTLWLYECILAACLIFIIVSALSEWLAWTLAAAIYHICFAALKLNETIASLPLGNMAAYNLSLAETVVIYLAAAASIVFIVKNGARPHARKIFYLATAAVLLLALRSYGARLMEGPEITLLDVGQGDCAAVRSAEGKWIFIDAGGGNGSYEKVLLPFIRRRRISEIEYLIITHAHADHYCNALKLYSNPAVSVKTLCHSKGWEEGDRDFIRLLAAAGKNKKEIFAGDTITTGSLSIDILWPQQERPCLISDQAVAFRKTGAADGKLITKRRCSSSESRVKSDANGSSIAAAVNFGGKSFLFCGDITLAEEEKLIKKLAGYNFELIKAPHHGSRTSNGEKFLRAADAGTVFISAGASNKFGHPHAEVVERYRALNYKIFDSRYYGGVSLAIGRRIKIFGHDMKFSY